jgi:hypothetical protein
VSTTSFAFRFDPRYRALLALSGITPERSWVDVGDGVLDARFGPWRVRTPLGNVTGASVNGPHAAIRAIGVRLSFADRGLTFGSNRDRTVCVEFAEPVAGIDPLGLVRHPGLSLAVADCEGLHAALVEAVPLP